MYAEQSSGKRDQRNLQRLVMQLADARPITLSLRRDSMKDHPDYDMRVTFAVLDDGILDLGQQILQELR